MSESAPKVFISYRRDDTSGHAGRIYDAVAARVGASNVFMDVDLDPGVDFVDRIHEAIAESDALLVVIGPRWTTLAREGSRQPRLDDPGDYVRVEVETALRRGDLTVIPLLVAGARMPDPGELPESLRDLSRRNALELTDARWRYDVGRLVHTIAEAPEDEAPGEASARAARTRAPGRGGRVALIAAAGAVVVLVVALAVAGVFSSGAGGGDGSGSAGTTAGIVSSDGNATTPEAEALLRKYEQAYEAKDLNGLKALMSSDVVLKKGARSQRTGLADVTAAYREELKSFGSRLPAFDWGEGGSDSSGDHAEVHGRYSISANGVQREAGQFGFLTQAIGSSLSIKELCFDCPDLHHTGGFLNS